MTSEPQRPVAITFAGVSPEFVLKVCERLLSYIDPKERSEIVFGGVRLRLYVNSHWAGFERYMLVGPDWTIGFNIRPARETKEPAENIYTAFSIDVEVFTPNIMGESGFLRDATVLKMTESDWIEDGTPTIW